MTHPQPRDVEFEAPVAAPVRASRTALLRLVWYGILALTVMAGFYTLYFARSIFIPIALAILLNLLLGPVVRRLARAGVPEAVGAALVLLLFLGGVGLTAFQLSGPAAGWVNGIPESMRKLETKLHDIRATMLKVKKTTEQVEKMTEGTGTPTEQKVVVKGPSLADTFLSRAGQVASTTGVIIVLLYFMLASGDLFLRKLVKVLPTLHDKKLAVEIVRQAESDISRYLMTVTVVNGCVGIATGLIAFGFGLPNPVLWGALAAVLHYIPYLGSAVMLAVLGMVAALTFDDVWLMLGPAASYLAVVTLEGQFLTPMLLGRRLTLNPVVIFVALLVWGWLWGAPGVLMAVPLLAAFKILCDHMPSLVAVGEFLGRKE
jgi:predicted PurR-regulated permease PerM